MERPGGSMFESALNREAALVRLVRELNLNTARLLRQNQRLPNFEILHDERASLEELDPGFECHFDEGRGWENHVALHLVVFQEGHVPAVQPGNPGRDGSRQP